jgi:hypothetical protein
VASVMLKLLACDYPYVILQCSLELEVSNLLSLPSNDMEISADKQSSKLADRCQTTYIHYIKSKLLSY